MIEDEGKILYAPDGAIRCHPVSGAILFKGVGTGDPPEPPPLPPRPPNPQGGRWHYAFSMTGIDNVIWWQRTLGNGVEGYWIEVALRNMDEARSYAGGVNTTYGAERFEERRDLQADNPPPYITGPGMILDCRVEVPYPQSESNPPEMVWVMHSGGSYPVGIASGTGSIMSGSASFQNDKYTMRVRWIGDCFWQPY